MTRTLKSLCGPVPDHLRHSFTLTPELCYPTINTCTSIILYLPSLMSALHANVNIIIGIPVDFTKVYLPLVTHQVRQPDPCLTT